MNPLAVQAQKGKISYSLRTRIRAQCRLVRITLPAAVPFPPAFELAPVLPHEA